MSLIDPTTPEGFFHMRLVPLKSRLLEEGKSFFPKGPNPELDSYFEIPMPTAGANQARFEEANLAPRKMLDKLRERWESQNETTLLELSEDLESLRQQIVAANPAEEEEEISDFVYPLF